MSNKSTNQSAKEAQKQKILTIVGTVLCILLIPILIINVTLIVKSYVDTDKVPTIGGWCPLIVLTDSMLPEISSGDLIFCQEIGAEDVKVKDVISFFDPAGNGTSVVTHRVLEIKEKDGRPQFVTKGDNNPGPDNEGKNPYTVHYDDIIGICTEDGKLPGVGNVINFLRSSLGFFLCIVLPLILFFLYELYNFITVIVSERAKKAPIAKETEEEIKRRAIEEYLKSQQALGGNPSNDGGSNDDNK